MTVIHVCAPNTIHGNPRRLYLELRHGRIHTAIDEGFEGENVLSPAQREVLLPTRINVTATEYNRIKSWCDAIGRATPVD